MQVVITTIFPPTRGATLFSEGLVKQGGTLWVMGDVKGPQSFALPAAKFYSIESQRRLDFRLGALLPEKHYTRKNLGYLLAMTQGDGMLVETDDDNLPLPAFWETRHRQLAARSVSSSGWFNAYTAFGSERIWPRGFPLELVNKAAPKPEPSLENFECLIQQGLANQNPDVDALYRMLMPLPVDFVEAAPVVLARGCWCPFNSQNTTWFKEAFPLLYLPSRCTFRMTDIWRSFVAQRCLWEMGSRLAFTSATVWQERNEHNLLADFQQEIPGYIQNEVIRQVLDQLTLRTGRAVEDVCWNLRTCYDALVAKGIVPESELPLVDAWIADVTAILS